MSQSKLNAAQRQYATAQRKKEKAEANAAECINNLSQAENDAKLMVRKAEQQAVVHVEKAKAQLQAAKDAVNDAVSGSIAASLGEISAMVSKFEKRPDELGQSAQDLIEASNSLATLFEIKKGQG